MDLLTVSDKKLTIMRKQFEMAGERLERHNCQSWQEEDWLYFSCPDCGFTRKLNWKTGELALIHQGDSKALHSALHAPLMEHPQVENSN